MIVAVICYPTQSYELEMAATLSSLCRTVSTDYWLIS
jgi:hypothetical protein